MIPCAHQDAMCHTTCPYDVKSREDDHLALHSCCLAFKMRLLYFSLHRQLIIIGCTWQAVQESHEMVRSYGATPCLSGHQVDPHRAFSPIGWQHITQEIHPSTQLCDLCSL